MAVSDQDTLLEKIGDMYESKTNKITDIVLDNVWKKLEPLINEITMLKKKTIFYENDHKRRNFVLYGVHENQQESFQELSKCVLNILNCLMQTDISLYEIDHIYRLGHKKSYASRPILVKCLTSWRKEEIMRNGKHLKGRGIYIEHDLSKEQVRRRRELIPEMMEQRKQGKHAVIKLDQLIVKGQESNEDETPQEMKVKTVVPKKKKNNIEIVAKEKEEITSNEKQWKIGVQDKTEHEEQNELKDQHKIYISTRNSKSRTKHKQKASRK
uniref:Uncharacterized protein n=1 Tax=Cacopsylla melanoneura TaxID=428564 RepID=A0A8D8WW90_9HEMI